MISDGDKIALGHHYDDVIETIFMGMLYGAQIQIMMPKLRSTIVEYKQNGIRHHFLDEY